MVSGAILDLEVTMSLKLLVHYCELFAMLKIVKNDTSFIIISHINQEISLFMFLENAEAAIVINFPAILKKHIGAIFLQVGIIPLNQIHQETKVQEKLSRILVKWLY